jgi:hypothetical protein
VERSSSYKLDMNVRSARKRKYEILAENEEIDGLPTIRDTIMDTSTHGDSALNDDDEYEPREQQTSLDTSSRLVCCSISLQPRYRPATTLLMRRMPR